MCKTKSWILLAILTMVFVACKKDNNSNGSSALSGTWTFNGFHATTYSSAQDVESGIVFKTVTTSDYTTVDNTGSVNISGNTMAGTGIGYTANMNLFVTDYQDNVIVDTFSTQLPITIPPTNSTSAFEVIGTDSIHYTSSGLIGSAGSGSPAANGAKFTIDTGVLTITSNVVVDKVIDTLGTTITQHETATVITTLNKQ